MRRPVAMLLIFVLGFTLTGCTGDELGFLSAVEKSAAMTSWRVVGEYGATMSCEIPEEEKAYMSVNMNSVLKALSAFKIKTDTTVLNTGDGMKGAVEYTFAAEDISFKSNVYLDIADDKFVETFKIPTLYRMFLPEEHENAEYMVMDLTELASFADEMGIPLTLNVGKQAYKAKMEKLQTALVKFQSDYAKTVKNAPSIITKKGSQYTLTLNDATLKLLLKSIADTYFEEESARQLTKDAVLEVITFYRGILPDEDLDEMEDEVSDFFDQDEWELAAGKALSDEFFAFLNKFPLLGDKGLSITYTLDRQGYITKVEGFADILIDVNAIAKATDGYVYDDAFNFKFLFSFKEEYTDVNSVKSVQLPTLTDDNSLSYVDMLRDLIEERTYEYRYEDYTYEPDYVLPAPDGSISVIMYGDKIDFGGKQPLMIDGTLYVPFEELVARHGYRFYWDDAANMMLFGRQFDLIRDAKLPPYGNTIYYNDFEVKLAKDVVVIDNYIYVPLRTFAAAILWLDVTWVDEENAAYIHY